RTSRWVAAGQAVMRIATAATAVAVIRPALLRNAAATSDGLCAGDGFRCREAAPAWPDDDRDGLRDTDGPSAGRQPHALGAVNPPGCTTGAHRAAGTTQEATPATPCRQPLFARGHPGLGRARSRIRCRTGSRAARRARWPV